MIASPEYFNSDTESYLVLIKYNYEETRFNYKKLDLIIKYS